MPKRKTTPSQKRFKVCLSRETSEDAAIVVEAQDEDGAVTAALAQRGELDYTPSDSAGRAEVYHIEEVDAATPLGQKPADRDLSQVERAAPALLAVLKVWLELAPEPVPPVLRAQTRAAIDAAEGKGDSNAG